ncbi:FHA domain-containing protein [Microbacterium murale]|uniref:PSer/pThr/pTyr-binding forkhead associated (FHA) protein n=1 Tax=Microbacterium murale TaxID=1081040 RepID=A0ABU0PBM1_9MICO|nr:FHA domain-containing protein [Microbacterium murale]MDQ0644066.1 pSer/pThr/pTyr-binding forkhead associated (FHA) protein [Microbacterium murale]
MSTQCRFCGEAVRPDSMFCPSCGQLTDAVAGVAPPFPGSDSAPRRRDSTSVAAPAPVLDPVPLPAPRKPARKSESAESSTPAKQPSAVRSSETPKKATGDKSRTAAAATPTTTAAAPTAVTLPDGQRLPLESVLVLGRSPEQGAAQHKGVAVRLPDPERAMSRVHLVISPVPDGATATDPGSANGTFLERAGTQYVLVAGTPTSLLPGDRLLLGDATLIVS